MKYKISGAQKDFITAKSAWKGYSYNYSLGIPNEINKKDGHYRVIQYDYDKLRYS